MSNLPMIDVHTLDYQDERAFDVPQDPKMNGYICCEQDLSIYANPYRNVKGPNEAVWEDGWIDRMLELEVEAKLACVLKKETADSKPVESSLRMTISPIMQKAPVDETRSTGFKRYG